MLDVKNTDLAYLAGLIDGEGTITASYRAGGKDRNPKYVRLLLAVYNTNLEVLFWIKERFGGSVHVIDRSPYLKPSGKWHAAGAARILELVQPYLIIKREQAVLGIALSETMLKPEDARKLGTPETVYAERTKIVDLLREKNRRGRVA